MRGVCASQRNKHLGAGGSQTPVSGLSEATMQKQEQPGRALHWSLPAELRAARRRMLVDRHVRDQLQQEGGTAASSRNSTNTQGIGVKMSNVTQTWRASLEKQDDTNYTEDTEHTWA